MPDLRVDVVASHAVQEKHLYAVKVIIVVRHVGADLPEHSADARGIAKGHHFRQYPDVIIPQPARSGRQYAEGKPDYADAFVDSMTFRWDSQIGRGPQSSYMQDVITAERRHLLVKKSDAESSFYYMGTFDVIEVKGDKKMDNNGKMRDISKVTMRMHHAVREDLLKYLESSLLEETI